MNEDDTTKNMNHLHEEDLLGELTTYKFDHNTVGQ